jgi:putative tryptophan/tyrosine transport system substrate-binding protein
MPLVAGIVAGWPLALYGQQRARLFRIALVHPSSPVADMTEESRDNVFYPPLFRELRKLGYVEGQNLSIERKSAEGRPERYAEIVRDVIGHAPDVIFVNTSRMALQFKNNNSTLPMVMVGTDPVALGIVDSLSHPGKNITGFTLDAGPDFVGKHLQLLRDMLPKLNKVGFLAPRAEWDQIYGQNLLAQARLLNITVVGPPVEGRLQQVDYVTSLTTMAGNGCEALLVSLAPESLAHRAVIMQFAQEHRWPALYPNRVYVKDGGLAAYSIDFADLAKGMARYIDSILKGVKAADLPMQQPVRFDLVINLKAAKTIGIEIPPSVVAQADEVIE